MTAERYRLPAVRRPQRLAELAYETLRNSILDGTLDTGEHLIETQLAAELSMSRAPIREAIKRLIADGLVVERQNQGVEVLRLSARDIADLYNLRAGLETTALRLYIAIDGSTEALWSHISDMESAVASRDLRSLVRAEMTWHRHISENCGNDLISRMCSEVEHRATMAVSMDDSNLASMRDVVEEHASITRALDSGKTDRAVSLFERHLTATVDDLLLSLGGDPAWILPPLSPDPDSLSS